LVQGRGALSKKLTRELRRGHSTRRPRHHSNYNGQDRAVPGHWVADLLIGTTRNCIATLV
jgi:IS30 family transposase